MENSAKTMDQIVALCKNRGFVYPGCEIYGGLANSWDYGPLGVEFKNNVKKAWWKKFVQESKYNVGLDSAILMNPQTWVTSGHVGGFSDPLMDCRDCQGPPPRGSSSSRTRGGGHAEGMELRQDDGISFAEHEHRLPGMRQQEFYRHPQVQPDV